MRNILFLILCLVPLSLMAGVEEVRLTSYYPAPFGDFESIRSDSMELGGVLRGTVADGSNFINGVTTIGDLRPISVYGEFRVLGELLAADGGVATSDTVHDLTKVRSNGIFFHNARNGLFLDPASSNSVLRAQENLYLQPGSQRGDMDYSFSVNDISTSRSVVSNASMLVKGNFHVEDDAGKTVMTVYKDNPVETTGRPLIVMDADVVINGSLTVRDDIKSLKTIEGKTLKGSIQAANMTVGNLLVSGVLQSGSIQSTNARQFEIKVNGGGTIARFHRGLSRRGRSIGVALEIPGKADGWGKRGQMYV